MRQAPETTRGRSPGPQRILRTTVFLAIAMGLLLCTGSGLVRAEDVPERAAPLPPPSLDYLGLLARTQDELSHFAAPARWAGHDGALGWIWKAHVQKRGKRAQRYVKELQKPVRWHLDDEQGQAVMLRRNAWSPFLQRLTRAYAELAAARDGLKRINVSPNSAIQNWGRRNLEPDLRRRTPAEQALDSLRRGINLRVARREYVPRSEYVREAELAQQAIEERLALEAAHRQWIVDREAAIQRITAAVSETRNAAFQERERLELHLKNFQALAAAMQTQEEIVLRKVLQAYAGDASLAKAAKRDLAAMAKGRAAGLGYSTAKSSKWSSLVRKGWMQPRNHLVSAIKSAAGRVARAAKAAADSAAREDGADAPAGDPREPGK